MGEKLIKPKSKYTFRGSYGDSELTMRKDGRIRRVETYKMSYNKAYHEVFGNKRLVRAIELRERGKDLIDQIIKTDGFITRKTLRESDIANSSLEYHNFFSINHRPVARLASNKVEFFSNKNKFGNEIRTVTYNHKTCDYISKESFEGFSRKRKEEIFSKYIMAQCIYYTKINYFLQKSLIMRTMNINEMIKNKMAAVEHGLLLRHKFLNIAHHKHIHIDVILAFINNRSLFNASYEEIELLYNLVCKLCDKLPTEYIKAIPKMIERIMIENGLAYQNKAAKIFQDLVCEAENSTLPNIVYELVMPAHGYQRPHCLYTGALIELLEFILKDKEKSITQFKKIYFNIDRHKILSTTYGFLPKYDDDYFNEDFNNEEQKQAKDIPPNACYLKYM